MHCNTAILHHPPPGAPEEICVEVPITNAGVGLNGFAATFDGEKNSDTEVPGFSFADTWVPTTMSIFLKSDTYAGGLKMQFANASSPSVIIYSSIDSQTITSSYSQKNYNFDGLTIGVFEPGETYVLILPADIDWRYNTTVPEFLNIDTGLITGSTDGMWGTMNINRTSVTTGLYQYIPSTCTLTIGGTGYTVCLETINQCP